MICLIQHLCSNLTIYIIRVVVLEVTQSFRRRPRAVDDRSGFIRNRNLQLDFRSGFDFAFDFDDESVRNWINCVRSQSGAFVVKILKT